MAEIHELRNRLTTAILTVTAMVDGKMPSSRSNLRHVGQTLADIQAIVANARDEEWVGDGRLVDLTEIARRVVDAMMVLSAAADVTLVLAGGDFGGCRALRADPIPIYRALDGALQILVRSAPAGSTIEIKPLSAQALSVAVRPPKGAKGRDPLEQVGQALTAYGGRAGRAAGSKAGYRLEFPGTPVCACAAARCE